MSEDMTTGSKGLPTEQSIRQFTVRPLQEAVPQASALDNFWFEGSGISKSDLSSFLKTIQIVELHLLKEIDYGVL